MNERRTRGVVVLAAVGVSCASVACLHDFSVFDPVAGAGDDSGSGVNELDAGYVDVGAEASTRVDSGSHLDAGGSTDAGDAGSVETPEAEAGDTGSSCGSDCRIEATGCAGTCAFDEQSCAAACTGADAGGCTQACLATESSCTSPCVTECETCTSGEGCIDIAGCMKAAP